RAFTQIEAILSQTNHGVHMSLWASIEPRYQIGNPFFSLVQLWVDSLRNPVLIKIIICTCFTLQHHLVTVVSFLSFLNLKRTATVASFLKQRLKFTFMSLGSW